MNQRALVLPAVSLALVAGLLGVQTANGGGDFVPARAADPCVPRVVTAASTTSIDALGEVLVLYGIDATACRIGVSREQLVLTLGIGTDHTEALYSELRAGLLDAVERMKRENLLPPASALADEALADADLNRFLQAAIRALPDRVVDAALKTDDVLRRAITDLDLRRLLDDLDQPNQLQQQISAAVTQAVKDSLTARLRSIVPDLPDLPGF
ncbi:hypothetical protein [Sporichthya polymorpha]|uniref:hypothetical protein n=1 Tax=Sporichthya polymorpha TaxID=35751 RepID=UPI000363ED42|nr:hypothetical protein [Sporichthya polymorpha]